MGYTHCWKHTRYHSPARVAAALRPLIEHGEAVGVLAGPLGAGRPDYESPAFNGRDDLGLAHETFSPCEHMPWNPPRRQSGVCKTDRKPYDSYVVAALYRLKAVYPKTFIVDSDGYAEEWERGADAPCANPRDLYREVYGDDPPPVHEVLPDRCRSRSHA